MSSKIYDSFLELIGKELTDKIVVSFGGSVTYISKSPFLDLIGPEASARLGTQYAGYTLRVPLDSASIRLNRNRGILELLARGATARQVATAEHVTPGTILRIKRDSTRAGGKSAQPMAGEQVPTHQPPPK